MVKTEKEVQKQVIETFKSMGYAYLGDLTKSDNENINKESLKAWLFKNQKINDERWHKIEHEIHKALKNDLYEANQKFYELLIYGVRTKISQNENTQTTWLIDWKDVSKNGIFKLNLIYKTITPLLYQKSTKLILKNALFSIKAHILFSIFPLSFLFFENTNNYMI